MLIRPRPPWRFEKGFFETSHYRRSDRHQPRFRKQKLHSVRYTSVTDALTNVGTRDGITAALLCSMQQNPRGWKWDLVSNIHSLSSAGSFNEDPSRRQCMRDGTPHSQNALCCTSYQLWMSLLKLYCSYFLAVLDSVQTVCGLGLPGRFSKIPDLTSAANPNSIKARSTTWLIPGEPSYGRSSYVWLDSPPSTPWNLPSNPSIL